MPEFQFPDRFQVTDFINYLRGCPETALTPWLPALQDIAQRLVLSSNNGNIPRWQAVLQSLPRLPVGHTALDQDIVVFGSEDDCDAANRTRLMSGLRELMPWRKGPFDVYGIDIDTEWRSDWKWRRVLPHISPLKDRLVLDVGCGNGYHCWRMAGAGARLVLGIDPTLLYFYQFLALRGYAGAIPVYMLPLKSEDLPAQMAVFDTVFSMGVLYHRRSPFDHLQELREALRPGGELVLETLVIEGNRNQILVPAGRYAKMNNVWFLPSCPELESWLQRMGFTNIKLADLNQTTIEEQRGTEWMRFESLADFLDPVDSDKTIEGYPAPKRACFIATRK